METKLRMQRMRHRNAKKTSKWTSSSIAAAATTTQAREDNLSEWIVAVVGATAAVASLLSLSLLYHFYMSIFYPIYLNVVIY